MTITPEGVQIMVTALLALVAAFLGALGASISLTPKAIKDRLDDWKQDQDVEREKELSEIRTTAMEAKAKVEETISMQTSIASLAASVKVLAESAIATAAEMREARQVHMATSERVNINTTAVEANTQQVGRLDDTVKNLLEVGSKPLQSANQKLDNAQTKLDEIRDIITSIQEVTTDNKDKLERIIQRISEEQISLTVAKHAAQDKLNEIKHKTGELPPPPNSR